ncbi:MAG: hypothetical protein GC171_16230 [Terrimonas sp.]|nr:hypothetical protein [Terrimonas sp.]
MKKLFWIPLFFMILPWCGLDAQQDTVITLPAITVKSSAKVLNKLNKVFEKSFPDAMDLKWYKQDKDYLAKFMIADMEHNALFKQNGYLKYDIGFGYEHNLPQDLKTRIQSVYPDCKIFRVVNLRGQDRNVWVVNLEGLKNYYLVKMEESEMEQIEKIVKAE